MFVNKFLLFKETSNKVILIGQSFSTEIFEKVVFLICIFFLKNNGSARFFTISMITEGTTEKVLLFILALMSIYIKKLWFRSTKMYF